MADWHLKTPVAIFIFKRPDTTQKVFEAIRQAKPPKLLVVSNISPVNKPDQAELNAAARAIIERVDWDCEVVKNYSDTFLSAKDRIYTGLNWIFDNVEEAIILEDDCVPHPSFFRFCEEILEYYRDEPKIMGISGSNFLKGSTRTDYSYYYSLFPNLWGWASWRRAWQHMDLEMKLWPEVRDQGWLMDILSDSHAVDWWSNVFQAVYENRNDTWDCQWVLSCWLQQGLYVVSNVNLVSNIGFGLTSTHTRDIYDWRANMPVEAMSFPLKHPNFILRDSQSDSLVLERDYYGSTSPSLMQRMSRQVRRARSLIKKKIFARK